MSAIAFEREYCAKLLRDSGSSFGLAFALLPKARREALMSIYAFCRLVDDIADLGSDDSIAEIKLRWWQEEIARAFADGDSEPAQHPVARCLREDARRFGLDIALFMSIIDGVGSDVGGFSCQSREQLMAYCYRVSCCVGLLSIEVFGYQHEAVRDYAVQLGYAMQLTNIIRDVRQDARLGRVYLPADELRAAGIEPAQLASERRTSERLRGYLEGLGKDAEACFDKAFALLPPQERRAQLAGLVMGQTYRRLLAELRCDGYRVMEYRLELASGAKLRTLLATCLRVLVGAGLAGAKPPA